MRTVIVGAGSVGGYFGGRLAEAGADVRFLVRPQRRADLERTGLRIFSPLGDVTLRPKLIAPPDAPPVADLVLLACKAHSLADAAKAAGPAIGPRSRILPLLNGLDHLDALNASFGKHRVLGGLAHIGATIGAEGEIQHLNRLNVLRFGAQDGAPADICRELEAAFGGTVVDARATPAIVQEMWDKFVFVATLAGVTCLMRASIGVVASSEGGPAFIAGMLEEASAVAAAEGHAPDADRLASYRAQLLDPGSRSTASMLRDVQRGGVTEADHILGSMVRCAARRGLSTPKLATAWLHLQAYESQRQT